MTAPQSLRSCPQGAHPSSGRPSAGVMTPPQSLHTAASTRSGLRLSRWLARLFLQRTDAKNAKVAKKVFEFSWRSWRLGVAGALLTCGQAREHSLSLWERAGVRAAKVRSLIPVHTQRCWPLPQPSPKGRGHQHPCTAPEKSLPLTPLSLHTTALRRTLLLGSAALLAGCGFKQRQAPALPFRTLMLNGFKPTSAMGEALRVALRSDTSVRVVENAAQAEVVLDALVDSHDKIVMASTATAQVREIQLRTRFRFSLRTPAGKVLIAPSEIALSRDMSFNEKDALAKGLEEQALYLAMHQDIAMQVLRRLATAPPL